MERAKSRLFDLTRVHGAAERERTKKRASPHIHHREEKREKNRKEKAGGENVIGEENL